MSRAKPIGWAIHRPSRSSTYKRVCDVTPALARFFASDALDRNVGVLGRFWDERFIGDFRWIGDRFMADPRSRSVQAGSLTLSRSEREHGERVDRAPRSRLPTSDRGRARRCGHDHPSARGIFVRNSENGLGTRC